MESFPDSCSVGDRLLWLGRCEGSLSVTAPHHLVQLTSGSSCHLESRNGEEQCISGGHPGGLVKSAHRNPGAELTRQEKALLDTGSMYDIPLPFSSVGNCEGSCQCVGGCGMLNSWGAGWELGARREVPRHLKPHGTESNLQKCGQNTAKAPIFDLAFWSPEGKLL